MIHICLLFCEFTSKSVRLPRQISKLACKKLYAVTASALKWLVLPNYKILWYPKLNWLGSLKCRKKLYFIVGTAGINEWMLPRYKGRKIKEVKLYFMILLELSSAFKCRRRSKSSFELNMSLLKIFIRMFNQNIMFWCLNTKYIWSTNDTKHISIYRKTLHFHN